MQLNSNSYLKIFIAIALIVSIIFNVIILKTMINTKTNNINNTTIRPVERIIEVRQNVVFKKTPIVRPDVVAPSGDSKEKVLLARLENATPSIKTEPIILVQFEDGSVSVNSKINGSMDLDYLHYYFVTDVKLDIKTVNGQNNIHALSILKFQDNQLMTDVGAATTLDFWDKNLTIGLTTGGPIVGAGSMLTRNSSLSLGLQYSWDGTMRPYAGLSFRL